MANDFVRIDNPYITGNPVRGSKVFFGREDDFEYVRHRLVAEKEGIILLFVGGRRSGKTSILFQILDGRLGPEFLPIWIDMQSFSGIAGDGDFLGRMARLTIEGAGDERLTPEYYDFAAGNPILAFDRLLEDLAQVYPERRLLFLVDEAELLRNHVRNGVISQAVLTYLSSILESRGVSFCFTGSMGLASGEEAEWQRLLGKGDFREITFLSRRDTLRLAAEPVEGAVEYGESVLDAIYNLTYGHPFYTQLICTNIVDHLNGLQRHRLEREDLDEVVRTIVANPPPQMTYDWEQFSDQQQLVLSLLSETTEEAHEPVAVEELVRAVEANNYPIDLSPEVMHLVLDELDERKVVERADSGGYHFLVDLVRLWIRRHRSIWRLVEEAGPARGGRRRLVAAAAAAAAVVAVGAALLWPAAPAPEAPLAGGAHRRPEGKLRIMAHPPGSRIEVRGPLDSDSARAFAVATTPELLPELEPGPYRIETGHPLYAASVSTLEVVAHAEAVFENRLQRLTGQLSVFVEPADAAVTISGRGDLPDTSLPGSVDALVRPTGTYVVRATRAGYIYEEEEIAVAAGISRAVTLALTANTGQLVVRSQPPGAAVWVDGEPSGQRTPATLESLSVGPHRLALRLAHHLPAETTVTVGLGETRVLTQTLAEQPGTVVLASEPPGARVFIDGVEQPAVTPDTYPVAAGEHEVRFELEGYDAARLLFDIGAGEERRRSTTLVPQYGRVQIVYPHTGTLYVDDVVEKQGVLGFVELQVGERRLRLQGYGEEKAVRVVRDSTVRIKWDLDE